MAGLNEHITIINLKLQQLLKQHEALLKENQRYRQSVEILQKQQDDIQARLNEIQQQNLILKMSAAPLNTLDKKNMEQRINEYIRTIDKCITILGQ